MKSIGAFDGATDAQRTIIHHWHQCRCDSAPPHRHDLDPGRLRAHLSGISILKGAADGALIISLAGSRLCEIGGRDLCGQAMARIPGAAADLLKAGLSDWRCLSQPAGGIRTHRNLRHAWLRLPLQRGEDGAALILCHDALLARSGATNPAPATKIFPMPASVAA